MKRDGTLSRDGNLWVGGRSIGRVICNEFGRWDARWPSGAFLGENYRTQSDAAIALIQTHRSMSFRQLVR